MRPQLSARTTLFSWPAPAPLAVVDALRAEIKLALAAAFGGYTETVSTGGYVAESGELIEERVYLVQAFYEVADDELISSLAAKIKTALQQESVMVRKDHAVFFQ